MYWMISVLWDNGLNAREKLSRSITFIGNWSVRISLSIFNKTMKIIKNITLQIHPKCRRFVSMQENRMNSY